jgi:hypothetical protein
MVLGSAVNYRCMAFAVDNAFLFSQLVTLEFALSHAYIDSFPSMTDPSEQSDSAASSSGCRKRAKSRYPGPGKGKTKAHFRVDRTDWIILFLAERAKRFSQVGRFSYTYIYINGTETTRSIIKKGGAGQVQWSYRQSIRIRSKERIFDNQLWSEPTISRLAAYAK